MTYMYVLIAALVVAGWVAVFISSRVMLGRTCAELRFEFQRQLDSLSVKIDALEQAVGPKSTLVSAAAVQGKMDSAGNAPATAVQTQAADEITPATLATITETVTALLGRKVHIRSVKVLPAPDAAVSPWAQHGRAVVQASRDFSQRSRP